MSVGGLDSGHLDVSGWSCDSSDLDWSRADLGLDDSSDFGSELLGNSSSGSSNQVNVDDVKHEVDLASTGVVG